MRLWYWIRTALKNGFIIIAASLLGTATLVATNVETAEKYLIIAFLYVLLFGAAFGMMLDGAVYKLNLPVALSFGSTRKEAFAGLQCYHIIYTLLILAASVVLFLLAGYTQSDNLLPIGLAVLLPIGLAVLLLTGALGAVTGVVSIRFGKGVVIATSVATGILPSVIAGVLLYFGVRDGLPRSSGWFLWLLPAAVAVLRGLCLIPEYKTVYKYNVKL